MDGEHWRSTDTRKLLGILYKPYRPEMYYFESIHMLYKVTLWGSLVMFEKGSQFQLALGLLICFFQVATQAYVEQIQRDGEMDCRKKECG